MTLKARALGITSTTYVNASGLPAEEQVTTARDQPLLGRATCGDCGATDTSVSRSDYGPETSRFNPKSRSRLLLQIE